MSEDILLDPAAQAGKLKQIFDRLLAEKGIGRYEIFTGDEEASEILPGGIYPQSGSLLTGDGRVFHFWLSWDKLKHDYTLGEDEIDPGGNLVSFWGQEDSSQWDQSPSFQEAKRKLGLE
ncbi:hypothetical protein CMO96_03360 [Candidatus Woesebacteria bacterium]|nr:hypothetical protein [Candidatus Woesebacteria bacterium]